MKKCFLFVLVLASLALVPTRAWTDEPRNQWIVTPGNPGSGGTINVTIGAIPDIGWNNYCLSNMCGGGSFWFYLTVTPCPLARTCTGGTYNNSYYRYPGSSPGPCSTWEVCDTLSLRSDVEYTFNGSWSIQTYQFSYMPPYDCGQPCSDGGPFTQTSFIWGATPAGTSSWGRLKVLYR
jgi:hypothetical protein